MALRWERLRHVLVGRGSGKEAPAFEVERARSYRDRLILKLQGIDDANAAFGLRGCTAWARAEDVPKLPDGTFFAARLVGLTVLDEADRSLGTVVDVTGIGGADMLVIEDASGRETLVPLAKEFVLSISEEDGIARVRLPDGLEDINRDGRDGRDGRGGSARA